MEKSFARRAALSAIALLSMSLSAPAFAQYVWIDSHNVRHYSDQPPPPSVPKNRILKTPRGVTLQSDSSEATSSSTKKTMTLAEKNADFEKRRLANAEKNKKAEETAKQEAAKQRSCDRNRSYAKTLDSGQRVVKTGENGERTFMSDEDRARESADVHRNLENC